MSKYKVGDKFVIEIEETICGYGNNPNDTGHITEPLHRIKGFNTLVFDAYGLDKLQQINPKLKIEDIDDMLAEYDLKKEAYEQGMNDAWELARKIGGMTRQAWHEIFKIEDAYFVDILDDNTYQQALAKIEAYEESKAIKVGDVVYANGVQGVVIDIISDDDCYIYDENGCIEVVKFEKINKTGRTVDIEHLLKQIRGDE